MNPKMLFGRSLKFAAVLLLLVWYVLFGRDLANGSMSGAAVVALFWAAVIYEIGARLKAK